MVLGRRGRLPAAGRRIFILFFILLSGGSYERFNGGIKIKKVIVEKTATLKNKIPELGLRISNKKM
ncbi:hypothetical protein KJ991_01220 [Patescibacteria group bacterium]|nr:hypothetical protein [Patescibacteria group bacterium]MBU4057473.1 hypothetical protein [Patescibacteria group bacterium]MBU4115923.1 hypothetical protein [Patescibacteria group bacterium]